MPLPSIIQEFRSKYPDVALHMKQGTPEQIAELAASGAADFAIATEGMELFKDLVMMPCYEWNRSVVVPTDHPLVAKAEMPRASRYKILPTIRSLLRVWFYGTLAA